MNARDPDNEEATPASPSHAFVVGPTLTLPDRRVNASTIEDAYVSFIFYCNPALPLSADTESLREAFRTPPKSCGKVFDTFTIFELVQKFYQREIKTWAELTTTLGVEPPDLAKDESAQKVAQYGVRLKKWMNSMHVKAFFEYLMNIPNDYWTRIPSDPNPVGIPVRDGVAIEDDMALRALLPYIRPRRGRKRPEEDGAIASPLQRPRFSVPLTGMDGYRQGSSEPWSAHPGGGTGMPSDQSRTHSQTAWTHHDSLETSANRWPHSAITPTTRESFRDDALEPRSAVTPDKGKPASTRRGAKNVSSAWKPAGQEPGTRTRGRPPMKRTSMDDAAHYNPAWPPTQETSQNARFHREPQPPLPPPQSAALPPQSRPDHHHSYMPTNGLHLGSQAPLQGQQYTQTSSYEDARPARPSISLQVPERPGRSVRLATPPPPLPPPLSAPLPTPAPSKEAEASRTNDKRSGQSNTDNEKDQEGWQRLAKEAADAYEQQSQPCVRPKDTTSLAADEEVEDFYFDKMENRTNVDLLVAYFTRSMIEATWCDQNGNSTPPVDLAQSIAMVHATLQTMYKTATSPQAFLINLAALAGSTALVRARPKCTRLGEQDGQFTFKCEWNYQFGGIKGGFTFEQVVPATMWAKANEKTQADGGEPRPDDAVGGGGGGGEGGDGHGRLHSKEYWQRKYQALTVEMMQKDKDLSDLREKVMGALGRNF
ncbi:hypothetical protein E4U58_007030 [Claviceps cyperi]|nr:hypothetical protein E4U58_007030 [Claviceps cyperi]